MADEWQSIETAPKDRSFWGWHESYFEPEVCRWDGVSFMPRSAYESVRTTGYANYYSPAWWKPRTDVPQPPVLTL